MTSARPRLILFTRFPVAGKVKTRRLTWGPETGLAQSLQIPARTGLRPTQLAPLDDLDRPEDLAACRSDEAGSSGVSVIIPALNEAAPIAPTFQSVRAGRPHETILVDGGGTDDTRSIWQATRATEIRAKRARARQLNPGASRATGDMLLFLHADTLLSNERTCVAQETLDQPGFVAGSFSFRRAEHVAGRRLEERTANLRARWFQNPCGDWAQILRRAIFEEPRSFAALPTTSAFARINARGSIPACRWDEPEDDDE